jgi:hypothetical protein
MSRGFIAITLGCVLCGCSLEQDAARRAADYDDSVSQRIEGVLPVVTGVPTAMSHLVELRPNGPRAEDLPHPTVSLVLLSPPIFMNPNPTPAQKETFEYKTNDPDKLRAALRKSEGKGYLTLLQPEFITACECSADKEQGEAEGTVEFEAEGLYRGKIEFSARLGPTGWELNEFRLPGYQLKLVRFEGYKWKLSKL